MGWKNVNAVIADKLFLGNLVAARSSRTLSERHITHIVSVCTEPIPADLPAGGISQLRIPVLDMDYADLLIHFPSTCRFIQKALDDGGVVLVHCTQGLSRSAAVVAAYLMWSRRMNSTEAQDVVRRAREQVWINPGFQEQLILFELCQYSPSLREGIYNKWRMKIDQSLQAQAPMS